MIFQRVEPSILCFNNQLHLGIGLEAELSMPCRRLQKIGSEIAWGMNG
jgi:hypothetical protein